VPGDDEPHGFRRERELHDRVRGPLRERPSDEGERFAVQAIPHLLDERHARLRTEAARVALGSHEHDVTRLERLPGGAVRGEDVRRREELADERLAVVCCTGSELEAGFEHARRITRRRS